MQTAALTAIEPLLEHVEEDMVPAFQQLLGALLPCAEGALASGNEDLLVLMCQVGQVQKDGTQKYLEGVILMRRE